MTETARRLNPSEVAELLRATGKTIRTELSTMAPDVLRWHPAPGEWCALEVLGHLIEAEERGFAGRIRTLLERDGAQLESWDQEQIARERRDCDRNVVDMLAEFWQLRQASAALVERVRPEDLERGGPHPGVGQLRIVDLLHEWLYHDRAHVMQVYEIVQRFAWHSMGDARKFYSPSS